MKLKCLLTSLIMLIAISAFSQIGTNLSNYATSQTLNQLTLDNNAAINIPQTTAGITLTIPGPTATGSAKNMKVRNSGDPATTGVPLTLLISGYTYTLLPGHQLNFDWIGTKYSLNDWGERNTKQNEIPLGTNLQYYRGDKIWTAFPTQANSDWNSSSGISQVLNKPVNLSQFTNDSGFITSFTELDPLVSAYAKSLVSFSVVKTSTDALYYPLGNPSGYLTGFTELDPGWNADKTNYYTKTAADGRYLQSYTETDPLVSAYAKSLTSFNIIKTSTDALYYPLSGNPSNFLTGFTELDPLVSAYAKSLTSFNIIKASTDPLYKAIGYTPTSSEITTALGFTPVTNARTLNLTGSTGISISAGTQDLTANRAWTITNTAPDQTVTLTAGSGIVITGTYPNFTIGIKPVTINNAPARSANSNFTISSSLEAWVSYSITCSVTNPIIAGSSTANAYLEYSMNAGSTWSTPTQSGNASSVGVAVAIQLTNGQTVPITGYIPVNALVRIRTVTTGTASVSIPYQTEVTR